MLKFATSPVVEVHNAALDAVVVPEITLDVLGDISLTLGLDLVQLAFVLDCIEEEVYRGVLTLELVLMVAPRFDNLSDLIHCEDAFVLVPDELVSHLLQDVVNFVCHLNTPF